MPIVVDSVVHHFDDVLVWDLIAGAIRPFGNADVTVTDPITGNPVTVLWDGVEVDHIRTTTNGRATFVAQQGSVKLNARGLSVVVESLERKAA